MVLHLKVVIFDFSIERFRNDIDISLLKIIEKYCCNDL